MSVNTIIIAGVCMLFILPSTGGYSAPMTHVCHDDVIILNVT